MVNLTHSNSIIHKEFFKPLFDLLEGAKHQRNCLVLDDSLWLEAGVRRCLNIFQSGRDLIQYLAEQHNTEILVSTFFESLKSTRRLNLLGELLSLMQPYMRRNLPDAFEHHACLEGFDLYAGDGHFIAAACHDKAVESPVKSTSSSAPRQGVVKYATGHLYALDLRSHAMSHLTVADQIKRNKEHEMRALKRQNIDTLRQGAGKGRKVLYVWDRAGIDFRQWDQWKQQSGIYFLSRQKDNMKLEVIGEYQWSRECKQNRGVIADEIVATSQGVSVRRVTYHDADTAITFDYLTNLPASIPPGVVAKLYKSRWDIEKVFDEFKNKLVEKKSWASSATAKTQQARLLCLTHNLLTLMEQKIKDKDGVYNRAEFERRAKRERELQKSRQTDSDGKSENGTPQVNERAIPQHVPQRLSQRTVKFIRWLKNHLDLQRDWDDAIAKLDHIYSRL